MVPSRRSRWAPLAASVLFAAMAAGAASATTMVHYGTQKLLDDCDAVVLGRVIETQCDFHDARHGFGPHEIYTFTTIAIDRCWKAADLPSELTIEEAGGQVATKISTVDGLPSFSAGDEILLFVEAKGDGHWKTFGMFLGAMAVERRADSPANLRAPATPEGAVVLAGGWGAELIAPSADGSFELDRFLAAMERRLAEEGGER